MSVHLTLWCDNLNKEACGMIRIFRNILMCRRMAHHGIGQRPDSLLLEKHRRILQMLAFALKPEPAEAIHALLAEVERLEKLNASIPDMLAALKWAATVIRPGSDLRNDMDAAITKAEGGVP